MVAVGSFYPDIGRQIRTRRLELGWDQAHLGGRLGVSHAAISDIERGKTKPNVDDLMTLAVELDTTLAFLLAPVLGARLLDVQEKRAAHAH